MGGTVTDRPHVFMVSGPKAEGTMPAPSSPFGLRTHDCNRDDDSGSAVFFSTTASSSIQQAEAEKFYYVQTPDFPHSCCSEDASGVTIVYSTAAPGSGDGGAISSALVSSSHMIQEQGFVPFLPAQVSHETHIIRDLQAAIPVYAEQRSASVSLKASTTAAADQAYGNWWNGRNVDNDEVDQAGTADNAPAAARARLYDLEQLRHRGTLVGDGVQGLSLSLSSQYQPQNSESLHLQSGRHVLQCADVEMNSVVSASISQAATGGVAANNARTEFSSRLCTATAGEPKFARASRFPTPVRKGNHASKAAIRYEFELGNCGSSAGRAGEQLPPLHEIEFCSSGSRSSSPADTISRITNCFPTSKFLRAAQELLVEVCRVVPPPKRQKTVHNVQQQQTDCWNMQAPRNYYSASISVPAAGQAAPVVELASQEPAQMCQGISSPQVPLISYHAQYITQSPVDAARKENRETLLLKKDDLMMILNEVEARHKRYREHFCVMMNNFNVHAGAETATPYLDLAFQTMSCQFRAVRDATNKQLRMVRRALGEVHVFRAGSGETSRHYQIPHDQWNCQQQAVQVMGTPQQHHSWRPQRGLPERAVTILRDWMTKNFLHPYPNDADKLLLAKQTCLTRSQVSNWFINARVRLWKPMVEEMYMEEQRIAAQEVNARRQLAETSGVPSKSLELFRRKLY